MDTSYVQPCIHFVSNKVNKENTVSYRTKKKQPKTKNIQFTLNVLIRKNY